MLLDKEIIEISKKNSKKMLAILQHDNEPELTEVFGKAYIKCNQKRNLALDVGIRGHHIPIDEPERAGGSDTGPTPVELLLAALGGCMEINWIFLCSLSKLDVTSVEIEVSGKWDRRYALGGGRKHLKQNYPKLYWILKYTLRSLKLNSTAYWRNP